MDSNSKRIAKNTLFLYLRMGLLMFISLFTSRVLLDKLGVEDFGVYNVIGGMAAMFTFFSSSLANATQRFLNIELGQNNIAKAKQIFQQHFTLYLAIIIAVIIIAEPIGIWLIYNKLVIPEDRLIAAVWVFQFTLLSLAATFVGIVFNSEIVSHEDMKIYSYIGIIEGVAKLLICYIISISDHNRLIFYGLLLLLVNLGIQGSYIRYCIKKYEECKIRLIWNVKLLKETTGIVGWNFIGTLVWMINDNCINLLLNMFFGPVVNAARAISYQINGALLNFTNNFFLSVRPQLMKSYAKGDLGYMNMLLFNSSRYSLYLLYVLAVPILFCIDQILALWLKAVPEYTNIFSVLIICYSFICVVHAPLWDVALASGQIKRYQTVGSCIFLLVFPISYVFLKLGYPPTTVMYVMIGVRICFYIASVIIVQAIANYSLWNYFSKIFTPVVLVVVPSLALHFIIKYYIPVSLVWMFIYIFTSILLNIVIIYIIGLNKSERAYILNIVRKKNIKTKMKILGIPCHPLKMAVINFVNLAAFYLSGTAVTNKKVLKSLKDKYTGKRCFIVCNGPSLRPEDLTKIHESGDISIAMNMIGRVYKNTPWRATFLSATDDCAFLKKNKKIVRETECDLKFYDERRYLKSLNAVGKKAYLAFNESLDLLDHPVFNSDMTKKIPSIGTSTYVCLELAVYLGCREIYLIGCDMSYKVNLNRDGSVTFNEAGKDHFYKSEEEAVETTGVKPNPTWQMKAAYDAAANAAKVQGFKIYNATRGGMLESFPRVDFDGLF